ELGQEVVFRRAVGEFGSTAGCGLTTAVTTGVRTGLRRIHAVFTRACCGWVHCTVLDRPVRWLLWEGIRVLFELVTPRPTILLEPWLVLAWFVLPTSHRDLDHRV